MSSQSTSDRARMLGGLWFGIGAYLSWGFFPLYFKAVGEALPLEILAHRIFWSTIFLLVAAAATGSLRRLSNPATVGLRAGTLLVTTLLISTNWLVYVWAVAHARVLEASLGYFITPLINVLFGVWFLRERLNGTQRLAVALAVAGVAVLVARQGQLPLVALALGVSFALYGLFRKRAGVDPMLGLFAETALLAPFSLAYLGWVGAHGLGHWGHGNGRLTLLLTLAGAITSVPLVWFNEAARRLPLSTIGLLQYLSPTCQLLLAVFRYGEPFTSTHAMTFAFIWSSLVLYTLDAFRRSRRSEAVGRLTAPSRT